MVLTDSDLIFKLLSLPADARDELVRLLRSSGTGPKAQARHGRGADNKASEAEGAATEK